MSIPIVLSFAAAYISMIMAVAVLFRDRQSLYHRIFASGMFLLAVEEILRGFANNAALPADAIYWQEWVLFTSAIIPGAWFAFSLFTPALVLPLPSRIGSGACWLSVSFLEPSSSFSVARTSPEWPESTMKHPGPFIWDGPVIYFNISSC